MSAQNDTVDVIADNQEPAVEPTMAALVGALSGANPINPLGMLYDQIGASNPQAAMIVQLLKQRSEAQAAALQAQADDVDEAEPDDTRATVKKEDLRELHETVEKVYAELETLRARNDALARALGACYICFGEDILCEECGGHGKPGSLPPDPAGFRQYVLPAVRRARAVVAYRHQSRGAQPEQTHGPSQDLPQQPAPDM